MDDGRETEGKQSSRGYMRISSATNKRIIAFAKLASLQRTAVNEAKHSWERKALSF